MQRQQRSQRPGRRRCTRAATDCQFSKPKQSLILFCSVCSSVIGSFAEHATGLLLKLGLERPRLHDHPNDHLE
jgi:hypothetical protein